MSSASHTDTLGPWPMTVMLGIRTGLITIWYTSYSASVLHVVDACSCIQVNLRQGSHKKRSLICVGTVFHYAL